MKQSYGYISSIKYQQAIFHSVNHYCMFSGSSGIVRPSSRLDYESMADKFYILNISATDNGHPKFTSYAVLNITVTDFNDNQPKFPKNSYNLGVYEDAAVGTYFDQQITATDEDAGENAEVRNGLSKCFAEILRKLFVYISASSTILKLSFNSLRFTQRKS